MVVADHQRTGREVGGEARAPEAVLVARAGARRTTRAAGPAPDRARVRRPPVGEYVERVGVQAHSSAGLSPSDPSVSVGVGTGLPVEELADRLVEVLVAELGHLGQVLAEAQRVVEVGGGGQQVGVRPDGVAGLDALTRPQRAPQRGGVAQPAGTQLEPDQGREGLLGGTTGGAATPDRLLHLRGSGHPLGRRLADHVVDPALDQGQRRLQPAQRGLLLGALLRLEQPALERLLDRLGVARVDRAHRLLDAGHVDRDAAAEVLDRGDQVLAQPRDVREQPLVGGLAEAQVEEDVVLGHVEPLGEGLDVVRHERGLAGRAERQPDVAGGEHLAGETAERGTDLAAEHRPAGLAEHPDERPGHRLGLLGHRVAHRGDHVLGDRLDQHPPDVGGLLDPLGPAPGGGGAHPGGEHGRVVEPVVGEAHRVGDGGLVVAVGAGVGLLGGGAARDVGREGPVHRPVVRLHHGLHLAHQGGEVGHAAGAGGATRPAERVEDLLERSALEGVLVGSAWVAAHGLKVTGRPSGPATPYSRAGEPGN